MRFPELPAPNTVIEVSAQDDTFNLIDVFFVPADLTPDRREGMVCGYLIRSDYARKDSDFGTPYTMNLLTHEWHYIDSPATSQLAERSLVGEPIVLNQIRKRIADCRTYGFGMHSADLLAHEDAPALVAEVERLRAVILGQVPVSSDTPATEVPLLYRDINEAALCALPDDEVDAILARAIGAGVIRTERGAEIAKIRRNWIDTNMKKVNIVADKPSLAEMDRQRRALEVAIGYSPVKVSIAGHPGIGYTHRTAQDRDDLVTRILDAGFRLEQNR